VSLQQQVQLLHVGTVQTGQKWSTLLRNQAFHASALPMLLDSFRD